MSEAPRPGPGAGGNTASNSAAPSTSSGSASSSPSTSAGAPAATASRIPKLPAAVAAARSAAGWAYLQPCVREAFRHWDLTRTAVAEQWGGPKSREKLDHIVDDLLMNLKDQWDAGNDVHTDSVDVYLLECLEQDFGIDFEDDSVVTEVSVLVQDVYRKCVAGQLGEAEALMDALEARARAAERSGGRRTAGSDDDDDDEDDEDGSGNEDGGAGTGVGAGSSGAPPRRERVVDEEGWETVVVDRNC
jgi:hypothetical protein